MVKDIQREKGERIYGRRRGKGYTEGEGENDIQKGKRKWNRVRRRKGNVKGEEEILGTGERERGKGNRRGEKRGGKEGALERRGAKQAEK